MFVFGINIYMGEKVVVYDVFGFFEFVFFGLFWEGEFVDVVKGFFLGVYVVCVFEVVKEYLLYFWVVVDCFDYFFICEEIEGVYYIDEFDRFWNVGYCNVENVVFFFFNGNECFVIVFV